MNGRFPDLIASARPAAGRFSYWLAGRDGKAQALAALEELDAAVQWAEASGFLAAIRRPWRLSSAASTPAGRWRTTGAGPPSTTRSSPGCRGGQAHVPQAGRRLPMVTPRSTHGVVAPLAGRERVHRRGHSCMNRRVSRHRRTSSRRPRPEPEPEVADSADHSMAAEPQHTDGNGSADVEPEPPVPQVRLPLAGMVAVAVTSGSRQQAREESGFTVDQVRGLVETMVERPGHSLSVPETATLLSVSPAEVPACVTQLKKVLNAPGVTGISFDRVSHVVVLDPGLVERALSADVG